MGCSTTIKRKKNSKVKQFYDEILQDYCFITAENFFKTNAFCQKFNDATIKLKERFASLKSIFKILGYST